MELKKLVAMSNKYGKNEDFVLAGGGNTSYKNKDFLYIKGSGVSLAKITDDGFVKMNRDRLCSVFGKIYPEDGEKREAAVLKDVMSARCEGEEKKRPSVETLLHEVLPFDYILHLHPAVVNGMTCGKTGKEICKSTFPDSVWVEPVMPGYVLAVKVKSEIDAYLFARARLPVYLFLENHGVFIGGDTTEEIDAAVTRMMDSLKALIKHEPDLSKTRFDKAAVLRLAPCLRALTAENNPGIVTFSSNKEVARAVSSPEDFSRALTTFSPDHMVYCSDKTLFVSGENTEELFENLKKDVRHFKEETGAFPIITGVQNLGFFARGDTKKEADTAKDVFLDAVKVSVYAESFGGGKPLPRPLIDAVNGWEAERYRRGVNSGGGASKRLCGKVAVITGGAQGFGKGIALDMAKEGAYTVIADLNARGAAAAADEINDEYGAGTALGLSADVGNEESVKEMVADAVLCYGGIDILVNNAGIVRAGSLDEMSAEAFELVTKINYTAYFLCAKHASSVMKAQYLCNGGFFCDIIQINSKSGLAGSNKNFAYAGGKFGGIGLTQSFALELIDYNIKVNSICPGNFLDGPLWTDPEKGLFVQYLRAGKIAGAKTVGDVKRAYEEKIPMKRGCLVSDVSKAIFYCVEQKYETGQAIPVTGGQVMLK